MDTYTLVDEGLRRSPVPVGDLLKPVAMDLSPSGSHTLVLRNGKDNKPFVELNSASTGSSLRIDASNIHGKMLGDAWFSAISWSGDERFVAYCSCTKLSKSASMFDTEGDANMRGSKFEFVDDWGEKYEGVSKTSINVLNVKTGKVISVVDGRDDDENSVGQPVLNFNPETSRYTLYYTSWKASPKRLGMIYCYQRPCSIFSLDVTEILTDPDTETETETETETVKKPVLRKAGACVCLTENCALARSPRVSPDGKRLVFIGRKEAMTTHNGCFQLYLLELGTTQSISRVVLDIVGNPTTAEEFPGLFTDQLPRQCFVGNNRVILGTAWGSRESVCVVDLESCSITRLSTKLTIPLLGDGGGGGGGGDVRAGGGAAVWHDPHDALCSVLDVDAASQLILFSASSPTRAPRIGVFELQTGRVYTTLDPEPSPSSTSIKAVENGRQNVMIALAAMKWKILTHQSGERFESILLLPPNAEKAGPRPLIVVPHGGPHSCMPTSFLHPYAFLSAETNSAILAVNYRGSTGFGQQGIDTLPGRIGANDVADMVQATEESLRDYPMLLDKNKLLVVGGSHGGFLTGHLIGQFPNLFKAAAMRNPVTNIPAMFRITDIPDWTVVECGQVYDFTKFTLSSNSLAQSDVLAKMLAASPVAHIDNVKTPCLICIGSKDRRVPASQGTDYYHLLKAKGVPTKMLVFPEDTHAIDLPASEAEHFIAIAKWFQQHL